MAPCGNARAKELGNSALGRLGVRVDATDDLVFDSFLTGRNEHDVHITGGAFVRF